MLNKKAIVRLADGQFSAETDNNNGKLAAPTIAPQKSQYPLVCHAPLTRYTGRVYDRVGLSRV
jgi:hypothetical protein